MFQPYKKVLQICYKSRSGGRTVLLIRSPTDHRSHPHDRAQRAGTVPLSVPLSVLSVQKREASWAAISVIRMAVPRGINTDKTVHFMLFVSL